MREEAVVAAEVERGRRSGKGEDQEMLLGSELRRKGGRHQRGGEERETAGKNDSSEDFGSREELWKDRAAYLLVF